MRRRYGVEQRTQAQRLVRRVRAAQPLNAITRQTLMATTYMVNAAAVADAICCPRSVPSSRPHLAPQLRGTILNLASTATFSPRRHNQLKFGKYRNAASQLVSPVPDIEELVATGKAHGVCPFYLGRDAGGGERASCRI